MSISSDSLERSPPRQTEESGRPRTFQYEVLESRDTFRLLRLHAGKGDRINCSLHHYLLGSNGCPSYRAVSYTWGSDTARFDIHLTGGSSLKVRKNLRDALRVFRERKDDCWLWIDAICSKLKDRSAVSAVQLSLTYFVSLQSIKARTTNGTTKSG